jgi:hypothetical protein
MNMDGCPMILEPNQWHVALKRHTMRYLDKTKNISCQSKEKLEKMKENLDKEFVYIELRLSFEHMCVTIGKILKTKHVEWLKVCRVGELSNFNP